MKDKWVRGADLVLFLLVIGLSGVLFWCKTSSGGNLTAYVYDDNQLVHQVVLSSVHQSYKVNCANGAVQIAVEQGKVQICTSNCPTQTCVRTGMLEHSGDVAACVPNRVMVVVQGAKGQTYQTY